MALLKPRVDLLEIVEAAYSCELDEACWAQRLPGTVQGALATGVIVIAHRDDFLEPTPAFSACTDPELNRLSVELWSGPAVHALRDSPELMRMFYPGRPHATHSELEPIVSPATSRLLAAFRRGAADAFALMAYPASGVALALWSLLDVLPTYARGKRRRPSETSRPAAPWPVQCGDRCTASALSQHTVANQIASILRKTVSRSRRDLRHSRLKRDD
jgi:hypothetical protein